MQRSHAVGRSTHLCIFLILALVLGAVPAAAAAQVTDIPQVIAPLDAPFEMAQPERPSLPDRTFDIRDYGAADATARGALVTD